jgi:hypothetical protein
VAFAEYADPAQAINLLLKSGVPEVPLHSNHPVGILAESHITMIPCGTDPPDPAGPVAPTPPVVPVAPVAPVGPPDPVGPVGPADPVAPVDPVVPFVPDGPVGPIKFVVTPTQTPLDAITLAEVTARPFLISKLEFIAI